jgi:hypothetical protein
VVGNSLIKAIYRVLRKKKLKWPDWDSNPGPSAHENGALSKCYQGTVNIITFLYGIYVTGSYAISAIVQFPRQLCNSLGNCAIS